MIDGFRKLVDLTIGVCAHGAVLGLVAYMGYRAFYVSEELHAVPMREMTVGNAIDGFLLVVLLFVFTYKAVAGDD